ncbi:MAG: hypothetical protein QXO74_02850 [Candidatus Methanomethylicia archaeon]
MNRIGQFRIIETLITIFLVIGSMIIAVNLQKVPSSWITYSGEDLKNMAFNILCEISIPIIEHEIFNQNENWENNIFFALNTLIPKNIYFNITIYEVLPMDSNVSLLKVVNRIPITNVPINYYGRIMEAKSAIYVHTSMDGRVYMIVLTLIRGGGG